MRPACILSEAGQAQARRDGNAGAGDAGAIGLFNAEGRLVSKDRVFSYAQRFHMRADLPGVLLNMVRGYVAGLREYGRIVPEPPGRRGFAKKDARR